MRRELTEPVALVVTDAAAAGVLLSGPIDPANALPPPPSDASHSPPTSPPVVSPPISPLASPKRGGGGVHQHDPLTPSRAAPSKTTFGAEDAAPSRVRHGAWPVTVPRPPAPPMRGLDSAGLEGRESGGAWPTIGPRRPGAPRSVTALRAQAESWEECVKEALDVVLQPVDIKVRPCRPCLPAVGRLLRGLGLSLEDLSRDWS
jgi:hypothetical protein